MKFKIAIVSFVFFWGACKINKERNSFKEDYVTLHVNKNISKPDLLRLKQDFNEKTDMDLNFDTTVFNEYGEIKSFGVTFIAKDGVKRIINAKEGFKSVGISIGDQVDGNGCFKVYTVN